MPRKDRPTGRQTKRAVSQALAQFFRVQSRRGQADRFYSLDQRLSDAERDALKHFHFGGRRDECGLSGTEELRAHGITEALERERFGGPSNFFQEPNARSGVIRR